MSGPEVEMVDNVKYLEVQIVKNLAWDEHTHFFRSKISHAIGFLIYANKLLPYDTLFQIYHGIVELQLHYSSPVLRNM